MANLFELRIKHVIVIIDGKQYLFSPTLFSFSLVISRREEPSGWQGAARQRKLSIYRMIITVRI